MMDGRSALCCYSVLDAVAACGLRFVAMVVAVAVAVVVIVAVVVDVVAFVIIWLPL